MPPVALVLVASVCLVGCERQAPESPAPPATTPPATEPAPPSSGTQRGRSKSPVVREIAPPDPIRQPGQQPSNAFAVYALSRGSGVPAEAREAQGRVEALVEADRKRGLSVTVEARRIGIEGERRLCVSYQNAEEGARAVERARALVAGIDLVNLVEEPCSQPRDNIQNKEEPK
jgi:hypothetical protein